jgi:hypothetical protein
VQLTLVLKSFSDMCESSNVLLREAIEHILRVVRVMRTGRDICEINTFY